MEQPIPSHFPGVSTWIEDFLCLEQSSISRVPTKLQTPTLLAENPTVSDSFTEVPIRRSSKISYKTT